MKIGVSTGNQATVDWQVLDDARTLASAIARPTVPVAADTIAAYERDGVVLMPGLFREWVEPRAAGDPMPESMFPVLWRR